MFKNLLLRDLRLAYYSSSNFIYIVSFFILVTILIPFVINTETEGLKSVFQGLIWVGLALALLLALDRIFSSDFDDGNLDIILRMEVSYEKIYLSKLLSVWITYCLPIVIIVPLISTVFNLTINETIFITVNLFCGSFGMTATAIAINALLMGLKRMIYLKSIIIIPLYIPFMIFGVEQGSWSVLSALSMIAVVIASFATSYGLRLYGE